MTEEQVGVEAVEAEDFNPEEYKADEVKEYLEDASEEERLRVAAREQAGKGRKTVLEAAGVDESVRLDASGRRLHPWEVSPPRSEG